MSRFKKLFAIIFLSLTLQSCADQSIQTINLDISLKNIPSNYGNYRKVKLEVHDDRPNKNFIGQKTVGGIYVNIDSSQPLVDLVSDNIARALRLKGFDYGDDKLMEVRIINFNYSAQRKFFIGHSKASALFRIIVKDKYDNNKKYQKNYGLTIDKDHFIMPLMKTDEQTINYILQETFNDIFNDNNLIENLKN